MATFRAEPPGIGKRKPSKPKPEGQPFAPQASVTDMSGDLPF
jgi:hypothetical protein